MTMRVVVLAFSGVVGAAGCFGPPPVFDDDIGVQAVPADVGAHAGTFALKTINRTKVNIPDALGGPQPGGGANYRLVRRSYDADAGVYVQSSLLCGGFNYEVLDVLTAAPESTYRAVPESVAEVVTIDHAAGTYETTGHVQLWGLQNLPDVFETAMPATKEEAAEPPWTDRIIDMEDDGNPGGTLQVSGLVEGEVYFIQRKTVTGEGVILGPDRAVGLVENVNETLTLGNNNPFLDNQGQGSAEPWPDPKESWFEEQRIDDDSDCDTVMSAEADGVLSVDRPF